MSDIIIIAGDIHKKLGSFFLDRGTLDSVTSYSSIHENESLLERGTYGTDKFIYVNFQEDMDVQRDMASLVRILQSEISLFSINELVVFTLESNDNVSKFERAKSLIEDSARSRNGFNAPRIEINVLDKPSTYETIYSRVLGIIRFAPKQVRYLNLYRVERNNTKGDLFTKEDTSSLEYASLDLKSILSYHQIKENIKKSASDRIIEDDILDVEPLMVSEINLQRFSYRDSKKSKILYFTGERRAGVTTHLLSVAISLISIKKSVTILDFSDRSDILKIVEEHAIPYNEISMKDLVSGKYVPMQMGLNLFSDYPVDRKSTIKWLQSNSIDLKTDFVLFDLPSDMTSWVQDPDASVVSVIEMEELSLKRYNKISQNEIVILTDLFNNSRRCSDEFAKEEISSKGIDVIIAPFTVSLDKINLTLMEEVLGGKDVTV